MGCVGDDLSCTEYDVSICAKDSHGPYDYEMVSRLVHLAQERNLDYAVDIYPRYGSDVGAAWSAGNDVKGALIGPGVHASLMEWSARIIMEWQTQSSLFWHIWAADFPMSKAW